MSLYHLTSIYHLPIILASGYLKTVESNISLVPREEHAGPDVVWMTTSPRAGQGWARMQPMFSFVDKTRIVFDLALEAHADEVHPWWDWALEHGSSEIHMSALAASGDERTYRSGESLPRYPKEGRQEYIDRAREEWFVIERAVPWLEWRSITDRLSGQVIWRNSLEQQKSGTMRAPGLWLPDDSMGQRVMVKPDGADDWRPTRILNDTTAAVQIGGDGPPDLILDARDIDASSFAQVNGQQEWDKLTPEQKRDYFARTAPSVNLMHDMLDLVGRDPNEDLEHGYPGERLLGLPRDDR